MNNARLSTNQENPKFNVIPLPNFDPLSLDPLYQVTEEGLIQKISNLSIVTFVKFYKITDINNPINFVYLSRVDELKAFFNLDASTIYSYIKNNRNITNKKDGITYSIEKIY